MQEKLENNCFREIEFYCQHVHQRVNLFFLVISVFSQFEFCVYVVCTRAVGRSENPGVAVVITLITIKSTYVRAELAVQS